MITLNYCNLCCVYFLNKFVMEYKFTTHNSTDKLNSWIIRRTVLNICVGHDNSFTSLELVVLWLNPAVT